MLILTSAWHKCDVGIDSPISAALNLIEFDTGEMRRMNQAKLEELMKIDLEVIHISIKTYVPGG